MQPKILIVEDEAPIREGLKAKLESEGHDIVQRQRKLTLILVTDSLCGLVKIARSSVVTETRPMRKHFILMSRGQ